MLRSYVGFLLGALWLLAPARLNGAVGFRSRHQHQQQQQDRYSSGRRHHPRSADAPPPPPSNNPEPSFDPDLPRNLTVQLGGTAYLPCKVIDLGNKSVSWIRNRDSHILTVDRDAFIVDDRFSSLYNPESGTWTLQIKYVQARDAGSYECQLSTEPKKMHFFNLAVVVPKVRIFGNQEIHVQAGSEVQLKCVVSQAVEHPSFIVWYHNNEMVVSTSRVSPRFETFSHDSSMGTFTIHHVVKSDAGNYSCKPANLHSASVRLHVVNGELSEPSIQGSSANDLRGRGHDLAGLILLTSCLAATVSTLVLATQVTSTSTGTFKCASSSSLSSIEASKQVRWGGSLERRQELPLASAGQREVVVLRR